MRTRFPLLSVLAVAAVVMLGGAPAASAQQVVKFGEGQTLTISGFVSATLFTDRGRFAQPPFGQVQNAQFSAQTQPGTNQSFTDGDFRNTRMRFDFAAQPVLGKWAPKATVEFDFFGTFTGVPPFGDEQPQIRGRIIYADLSNGRTTLRIGQDWSPLFAETPVSLTHIAFPLGYGASGKIGWRFPGIFFFQDLSAAGAPLTAQLQLAAMKGSGPIANGNGRDTASAIGTGEAPGLPQLEGKVTGSRRSANLPWSAYVVGPVDWKDTTGTGFPGSKMTGTAVELGGDVPPGPLTIPRNLYYGKASGQQFGNITPTTPAPGGI